MFAWNDDNTALLTKRRAEGVPFGKIAAEIGTTRNSAISKSNRLGLERTAPVTRANHSLIASIKAKARKDSRRRSNFVPWVELPKCEAVEPVVENPEPPSATRCSLDALTNETCRWPLWSKLDDEFLFCGAPSADLAAGQPYCPHHMGRAFAVRRGYANPLQRAPARPPAHDPPHLQAGTLAGRGAHTSPGHLPHSSSVQTGAAPGSPSPPCPTPGAETFPSNGAIP